MQTIYLSHSADRDDPQWFIVEPRPGHTATSAAGTPITPEMAISSLVKAGRTVIELGVIPFQAVLQKDWI